MPGTLEQETERVANALEAIIPLLATGNTALDAIKTSIDNLTINVTLSGVDFAISDQPRQPQVEAQAIRKSVTAQSVQLRAPKIIR